MAVRFQRTAKIERGKWDEAMEFAAEVSEYMTTTLGFPTTWGTQVGGTYGMLHWFGDYENMAELEMALLRTATDEGYRALLKGAEDCFVTGGLTDTIIYMM